MTTSITIPKRKQPLHHPHSHSHAVHASSSSSSYTLSSPSYSSSPRPRSPPSAPSLLPPSPSSPLFRPDGGEQASSRPPREYRDRRPSLLSTSLSAQEHTVINVGHPDGPPRLISCVKASQGFDWNQEIFLPSYTDHFSPELERKRDPVHEIVLTEEELTNVFPS